MLKYADVALGAKFADILKKDHLWDVVENIIRMSQLVEKITNIASNKHPAVRLKSVSVI